MDQNIILVEKIWLHTRQLCKLMYINQILGKGRNTGISKNFVIVSRAQISFSPLGKWNYLESKKSPREWDILSTNIPVIRFDNMARTYEAWKFIKPCNGPLTISEMIIPKRWALRQGRKEKEKEAAKSPSPSASKHHTELACLLSKQAVDVFLRSLHSTLRQT